MATLKRVATNIEQLLTDRVRSIDSSGIRRVFELGASLVDPINLSIGQPDFETPKAIREAAKAAIDAGQNGYTLTQGAGPVRGAVSGWLERDVGWKCDLTGKGDGGRPSLMMTSGTSGALMLAFMALIGPGDEAIIPDPYFVMYPHLATMMGGKAIGCDTYPDLRLTADRVEPLLTDRTKLVLMNSPSNPAGTVNTEAECRDLLELCRSRGIVLISDEIYDEFTFSAGRTQAAPDSTLGLRCPSPAREPAAAENVLLIRGIGKTYGLTGWRLGYAAGPAPLLREMTKLQQYTFVCPPSPLQAGVLAALDVDMSATVDTFERRRDLAVEELGPLTNVTRPEGAFYVFVEVPKRLCESLGCEPADRGTAFIERCIERGVLVINGGVFSARDTHLRISLACPDERLAKGLAVIAELMGAG